MFGDHFAYVGSEGGNDLARQRLSQLQNKQDGELCPWDGRFSGLRPLLVQQGSLLVAGPRFDNSHGRNKNGNSKLVVASDGLAATGERM